MYHDVIFHIHGEKIPAHRCVLSARSSYFAELFRTRWKGRRDIVLKHKLVLNYFCFYISLCVGFI